MPHGGDAHIFVLCVHGARVVVLYIPVRNGVVTVAVGEGVAG
jgi:hypothetical protein